MQLSLGKKELTKKVNKRIKKSFLKKLLYGVSLYAAERHGS